MFNPEKKIGASLLVLGMMISGRAMAQAETTPTCVKAPTCEELGYDKVASDCGELAKLRCPFDPDKYFCTAYTDQNGKKLAEIGDFVYVDAISAEPISGRIPVGIVYDLGAAVGVLLQISHLAVCAGMAARRQQEMALQKCVTALQNFKCFTHCTSPSLFNSSCFFVLITQYCTTLFMETQIYSFNFIIS